MTLITGTAAKPGWLINRNFALLWLGHTLSVLGDFLFETTLVVWIADDLAQGQRWASLAVSGLLVASAVPTLVVGPVAGVFVDRWDSRTTMLRADALSALLTLALLPAAGLMPLPFLPDGQLPLAWRLGAIYAVVFLASAVAQFFRPAALVLLGDLVPEPQRPRAAGLNQTSASLAMLIGPPLAAPLLFAFGAEWALLANAASFVASFLAVRAIKAPQVELARSGAIPPAHVFRDLVEGLAFFRRSQILVTVAVSIVIAMLGAGALNALDVFFVSENLNTPTAYFGILGAAQGAGMLLGALLATAWGARIGPARLLWGGLLALGGVTLIYARLTAFAPAVVVLAGIGVVIPAMSVAVGPIVLRATPRAFVGRVSATLNPLINAASILGALLGGVLYSTVLRGFRADVLGVHFGPLDTIFTGVGLLCLLAGLYAWANLRGEVSDENADRA